MVTSWPYRRLTRLSALFRHVREQSVRHQRPLRWFVHRQRDGLQRRQRFPGHRYRVEHGRHLPRNPWRQVLRRPGHAGHVRHSLLRHGLLRRHAAAPQAATSHRRRAGRSLSTEGGHQRHSLFLLDHLRPHIRHGFLLLHRRLLGPMGLGVDCVLLL